MTVIEEPATPEKKPVKPDNNLAWAILTTLFCCLPFGIAAIVYASQVDSRWAAGDYDGALDSSRRARNWSLAAAITGFGIVLLYILFVAIIALIAVNNS